MNAALHLTQVGPLERAAHRLGTALLRWSEERAAGSATRALLRTTAPSGAERSAARLAFERQSGLEARQRHWDELAAATPRLR